MGSEIPIFSTCVFRRQHDRNNGAVYGGALVVGSDSLSGCILVLVRNEVGRQARRLVGRWVSKAESTGDDQESIKTGNPRKRSGAGDEDRTRNFQLGKLTLYH